MLMIWKLFNLHNALTAKFLEPSTADKYDTHKIKVRVIAKNTTGLQFYIILSPFAFSEINLKSGLFKFQFTEYQ
jgi:hypothetical protein